MHAVMCSVSPEVASDTFSEVCGWGSRVEACQLIAGPGYCVHFCMATVCASEKRESGRGRVIVNRVVKFLLLTGRFLLCSIRWPGQRHATV